MSFTTPDSSAPNSPTDVGYTNTQLYNLYTDYGLSQGQYGFFEPSSPTFDNNMQHFQPFTPGSPMPPPVQSPVQCPWTPPGHPLPFPDLLDSGESPPSTPLSPPFASQLPSQSAMQPMPSVEDQAGVAGVCPLSGVLLLRLPFSMEVSLSPCGAVRLRNYATNSGLSLSGSGLEMSWEHPMGRGLQYLDAIEVQTARTHLDGQGKNAKFWRRGVSFTSDNCALTYLVDEGGARSITGTFHDLYAKDIVDDVFNQSVKALTDSVEQCAEASTDMMSRMTFVPSKEIFTWRVDNRIKIVQTTDGFVIIERTVGNEVFQLKSSPGNGKALFKSSFFYMTSSVGRDAHIYIRSKERRMHYNGKLFVVRNRKQSAGFDETGELRLW